jgi:hypothetical protein
VAHITRVTAAKVTANKPWTADDERLMLELRASGLTWRTVAQKLGRTEAATISRVGLLKARELDAKKE